MVVSKFENIFSLNNHVIIHALSPYFLNGKFYSLFWTLMIFLVFCSGLSLVLKALVSLVLKNWALLLDPLCKFPAKAVLYFWFKIVKFLAMFFRTTFILANLAALPEEALAFFKFLNYYFNFSMLALMVWLSDYLIFWLTLFSTIYISQIILLNNYLVF